MPECLWMLIPILLPVPCKLNEADPMAAWQKWVPTSKHCRLPQWLSSNGLHQWKPTSPVPGSHMDQFRRQGQHTHQVRCHRRHWRQHQRSAYLFWRALNLPGSGGGRRLSQVVDGCITHWRAERPGHLGIKTELMVPSFWEVAIGTNYSIKTAYQNILFGRKIGGTIHMAVGQSYKQTAGKTKARCTGTWQPPA